MGPFQDVADELACAPRHAPVRWPLATSGLTGSLAGEEGAGADAAAGAGLAAAGAGAAAAAAGAGLLGAADRARHLAIQARASDLFCSGVLVEMMGSTRSVGISRPYSDLAARCGGAIPRR